MLDDMDMTAPSDNPPDEHDWKMSALTAAQRQALERTNQWLESTRKVIVESALVQRPMFERVEKWLQTDARALLNTAAQFNRLWMDSLPQAWRDLEPGELAELFRLASDGTLCLVWAPRTDILRELIKAADFPECEAVLVARRDDILEDIDLALEDATSGIASDQDDAKKFAMAALVAARHGQDLAAQVLSGVALARVLHGDLSFPTLAKAREEMSALDPEEAALIDLRSVLIELATANSLRNTKEEPRGFNRHGTVHGIPEYFSEANMLGGVLLLTAWTRELSWLVEHHRDAFSEKVE